MTKLCTTAKKKKGLMIWICPCEPTSSHTRANAVMTGAGKATAVPGEGHFPGKPFKQIWEEDVRCRSPLQQSSTRSCNIGSTAACHKNLMSVTHKSSFISLEGSKRNRELPSPSTQLHSTTQTPKLLFFKAGVCAPHWPSAAIPETYLYFKLKNTSS